MLAEKKEKKRKRGYTKIGVGVCVCVSLLNFAVICYKTPQHPKCVFASVSQCVGTHAAAILMTSLKQNRLYWQAKGMIAAILALPDGSAAASMRGTHVLMDADGLIIADRRNGHSHRY